jgi:hypothetical protein
MSDARTLNWRFVVPDEPSGLLLLPVGEESTESAVTVQRGGAEMPPALPDGTFPAVAATDVTAWTQHGGRRESARLVAQLCAAVSPGGWVCVGFANARYPGSPRRRRSLRLHAVRRVLRRSGMSAPEVYACLPDHRSPGLLVPLRRAAELDYVLRRLFLTYAPADSSMPGLRRRVLRFMHGSAVAAPHRVRAALVPGYVLVSRRLP